MYGATELMTVVDVSAIRAKVDAYGSRYAIWHDDLIPQDFTGQKSINFYMQSKTAESEVDIYSYLINCRAATMNESIDIAYTVQNTINRKSNFDCFIYIQPLATIPPMDDRDNYNTPLDCIVKMRI